MTDQRIFMLTLIGQPGEDPIHGIRALLKLALRRYGLRCVQAREIAAPKSGEKPKKPVAQMPRITSE